MLVLFAIMFVAVAIFAPAPKGNGGSTWMGGALMAALMAGLAYYFLRQIMIACDFYEGGVVRRAWRRTTEYSFANVEWFIYNLVRQYHNGMYAGTSLTLKMKLDDGRTFSYSGTHKEKKKGFLINTRFEGEDEMDFVREAIEIHVAERIEKQLAKEGAVDWCDAASLTAAGLTPKKGKKKGTLVPWNELDEMWFKNGQCCISSVFESKKAVAKIPTMSRNFYPCLRVFGRLAERPAGNDASKLRAEPSPQGHFSV